MSRTSSATGHLGERALDLARVLGRALGSLPEVFRVQGERSPHRADGAPETVAARRADGASAGLKGTTLPVIRTSPT